MVRPLVVLAILSALTLSPATAQDSSQPDPALSGFITRSVSRFDFDVNGFRVVSTPKTQFKQSFTADFYTRTSGGDVFFGERVSVYGKINRKKRSIEATEVVFCKEKPRDLSGIAVIDRVLSAAKSQELLVRADGYLIQIDSDTTVTFSAPLTTLLDIRPNIWITYRGTRNSDGTIVARTVLFQSNTVTDKESNLLKKVDYDPSAVPSDSKQNVASKVFLGLDPKKIPPYKDPAMQARVDRIGTSLIPAYQHDLLQDDPSKIHFYFQLIDYEKFHDALTLPSGVILIPRQVVERLQNDSQLATVLADNIGTALEKQSYRMMPARKTMAATQLASGVGGIFVPGLGLATSLANYSANKSIETDLRDQSGRVSLGLLHDAGYDIQQAPVAWWLLASKPSQPLADTTIPPRAANLYQTIGLIWKNYPETHTTAPASTATNIKQ